MEQTKGAGCTIIYGGTQAERQGFAENLVRVYPQYRTEIDPVFAPTVKFGPFKRENSKSMYQIFMNSPVVKAKGRDELFSLFSGFCVKDYMDRQVRSLSAGQLERFALLYAVLHGKNRVLLHDRGNAELEMYFRIAACLNNLKEFTNNGGEIVWVTELSYAGFLRRASALFDTWMHSDINAQLLLMDLPYFGNRQKVVGAYLDPNPAPEDDEIEAIAEYQRTLELMDTMMCKE